MGVFKDYSTIVIIIFVSALVCDIISAALAIYALSVDMKWNSWLKSGLSNQNSNASQDFQDLGVDRLSHRVSLQVIFILAMIVMCGMTVVIFMYRAHRRNIVSLITFFFVLVCLIFIPALELISTFEIDGSYSRYMDLEGWGPSLKALRTCSMSKGPVKDDHDHSNLTNEAMMDEEDDEEFRKHGMCQEFAVKVIAAVFAFIGIFLILLLAYWGSFVSPENKSKVSSRHRGEGQQGQRGEGEEGDENYDEEGGSSGSNLNDDDEDLDNEGSGSNFSSSSTAPPTVSTSQDDLFGGGHGGAHGHSSSTPSLLGSSSGDDGFSNDEFGSTDFEASPMSRSRSDLNLGYSSSSHPTSASSSGMLYNRSKSNPSIFGGGRGRWGDAADDEAPPSPPPPTPSLREYSSEQKSRKSSEKSRNSRENQGLLADEQKSRKSSDLKSKKSKKSSESPKEHDEDKNQQKPKKKKKKAKPHPHSKNSPMFYDKFVETPQHSLNSTSSNSTADVAAHPRKTSHPPKPKK